MFSGRTGKWSRGGAVRRFVVASAIAVVVAAGFLPGSGLGSSAAAVRGAQKIPVGLAAAIHARLGVGAIRSSSADSGLAGPYLGLAVSLSADGTTALVGAPGVAGSRGAAYVFHASDAGSWSSSAIPPVTLTKKHGFAQGEFGRAVALSADGTTAFVSAPFGPRLSSPGAVYVFHVSAEDAWSSSSTPTATLTVSHSLFFGVVLALSADGTTLVVGDPIYKFPVGRAFVFHVSSEDAWASTSTPAATLSPNDSDLDELGLRAAISADGTTVLLTDFGAGNAGATGGGAAVYHVSAANAWTSSSTPTAILSDASGSPNDSRGNDLALSSDGTLALVSAPGAGSGAGGAVDVFHASGAAAWASTSTPTAILTDNAVSLSAGGHWVVPVAVSSDGTTALVLAPGVNSRRGAAYIFRAASEGAWASSATPSATLTNSGGHAKDFLGSVGVLSADGATALVGADDVQSYTGAAYVFHAADQSSWTTSSTPNATLTNKALAACVVPKLKGLKLPAARSALAVGRCKLGRVTKVHSNSRRQKGRVLSQNRKPGSRLAINAKVNVKIGK